MKRRRSGRIFLFNAAGNPGDKLIRMGLNHFLRNINANLTSDPEDSDLLVMHGGGSIDDVWHEGIRLIQKYCSDYPKKPLIIAPSSCHFFNTDFESVLNSCTQHVHFFCREKHSFKFLKSLNTRSNITVGLADDTALLLESSDFITELKAKARQAHYLFALRTDFESPHSSLSIGTINNLRKVFDRFRITDSLISLWHKRHINGFVRENFEHLYNAKNTLVRDLALSDFEEYIKLVLDSHKIYTDRLHVAILGALLGKQVNLYPTKFKKNQGVYEYSLKKYPHIKLVK